MPPAVAMVLAVVVVAEIAWAAFVLAGSDDLRPHAVPAVVAADPVVAESVARQYDDLPGDPFDLRAVTNEDTARAALDDGSARAALIVDLEGSVDRLLLASADCVRKFISTAGCSTATKSAAPTAHGSTSSKPTTPRNTPARA